MNDSVKIRITGDNTDYKKKMNELGPIAEKGTKRIAAVAGAVGGIVSSLAQSALSGFESLIS